MESGGRDCHREPPDPVRTMQRREIEYPSLTWRRFVRGFASPQRRSDALSRHSEGYGVDIVLIIVGRGPPYLHFIIETMG